MRKIRETLRMIPNTKRRALFLNWLHDFCQYIQFESKFRPEKNKKYNPGDIIDVNFGFNIGAELSGPHYAVVVEDNQRKDGTIMVVPLSSYHSKEEIHPLEVDLGIIPELNRYRNSPPYTGTKARISHLRSISKMRIYYPKWPHESLGRLSDEQLQPLYDAIRRRFCSYFPSKK
jgi:uncharacterized protein YifN (PemK superfamily)